MIVAWHQIEPKLRLKLELDKQQQVDNNSDWDNDQMLDR